MRASNLCIAVLGSQTHAARAQKILSEAAIPTTVIKVDSPDARRGCAWGIRFSCRQLANVTNLMQRGGIVIREILSDSEKTS